MFFFQIFTRIGDKNFKCFPNALKQYVKIIFFNCYLRIILYNKSLTGLNQIIRLLPMMQQDYMYSLFSGKTIPQVAIRWLIQKETVSSVIIGATSISQLEDNMGASSGWELSLEEVSVR